jgi:hypothetical protein
MKTDFDEIDVIVLVPIPDGLHGLNEINRFDQPCVPIIILEAGFELRRDA